MKNNNLIIIILILITTILIINIIDTNIKYNRIQKQIETIIEIDKKQNEIILFDNKNKVYEI